MHAHGEKEHMGQVSLTPSECSYAALRRATRGIGQLYDQALDACGLNAAQYSLLNSIRRAGEPTQSDLARDMVMDLSALGHTLKPLVREGFVVVFTDAADRRKRRLRVTEIGTLKLSEASKLQSLAHIRFEKIVGEARASELRHLLDYLASSEFNRDFQSTPV